MAKISKRAPTDLAAARGAIEALAPLGLAPHAKVRFRRAQGGRWLEGEVVAVEADGSIGISDARGRRRSIPTADVEVARRGPRGGRIWVPLEDVAAEAEQLGLF